MQRLFITALWLSSNIGLVHDAFGETRRTNGKASLSEFIGESGCPLEEFGSGGCRPGETCLVTIGFDGEIASHMYSLLAKHGVKRDDEVAEMLGSAYVQSSDELIFCFELEGEKTCTISFDPQANRAQPHQICD
jgi:hypothetical protein